MRLALISLLMMPLVVGCGTKTDTEKATEACLAACDSYAQYMSDCGIGIGDTPEAFCEASCADVEDVFDAGCGDQYEAVIEC